MGPVRLVAAVGGSPELLAVVGAGGRPRGLIDSACALLALPAVDPQLWDLSAAADAAPSTGATAPRLEAGQPIPIDPSWLTFSSANGSDSLARAGLLEAGVERYWQTSGSQPHSLRIALPQELRRRYVSIVIVVPLFPFKRIAPTFAVGGAWSFSRTSSRTSLPR